MEIVGYALALLTSPTLSLTAIAVFDDLRLATSSRQNDMPRSSDIATNIGVPLRLGGYGFNSLSDFIYASYAASILETAPVRVQRPIHPSITFYHRMARRFLVRVLNALNPEVNTRSILFTQSFLGLFKPNALFFTPERVQTTLSQAIHGATSRMY